MTSLLAFAPGNKGLRLIIYIPKQTQPPGSPSIPQFLSGITYSVGKSGGGGGRGRGGEKYATSGQSSCALGRQTWGDCQLLSTWPRVGI
jgi:hypothetical protein